jgi:hypothetical protein
MSAPTATLLDAFLEGPSQRLVPAMLTQLTKVPQLVALFGPYAAGKFEQRWADYNRFDWSIRQLPAVSVFESDTESKKGDNDFMTGTVRLVVYWPPNFRRSDLTRIPKAFHSAMVNFFGSELAFQLLDSKANLNNDGTRPSWCVPGLNEVGKEIDEAKNVEGFIESELVPVTMIDIRFRIDLRQYFRFLEEDGRTKDQPFERTLEGLDEILGEYDGLPGTDTMDVQVTLDEKVTINP